METRLTDAPGLNDGPEYSPDGTGAETLVELFGGQGTLNMNSWAPDSKQLAFVSYRYL